MEDTEAQAEDWSDWREQTDPWGVLSEKLSEDQAREVRLFMHQGAIERGEEARRNAFEEKTKRARERFEKRERERKLNLLYPFGHKIWVCIRLESSGLSANPICIVRRHRGSAQEDGTSVHIQTI